MGSQIPSLHIAEKSARMKKVISLVNHYLGTEEQIWLLLFLESEGFGPEQKRSWCNVVYVFMNGLLFTTHKQMSLQNQPGFLSHR